MNKDNSLLCRALTGVHYTTFNADGKTITFGEIAVKTNYGIRVLRIPTERPPSIDLGSMYYITMCSAFGKYYLTDIKKVETDSEACFGDDSLPL